MIDNPWIQKERQPIQMRLKWLKRKRTHTEIHTLHLQIALVDAAWILFKLSFRMGGSKSMTLNSCTRLLLLLKQGMAMQKALDIAVPQRKVQKVLDPVTNKFVKKEPKDSHEDRQVVSLSDGISL